MEQFLRIEDGALGLAATFYPARSTAEKAPVIVICHGFVGSRIGVQRLFVKAARELAAHGYAVLCFDYGGCGESPGDYGNSSMEEWIAQTKAVLDAVEAMGGVDPHRITLLGHSLGGAVAALTAGIDPRVRRLVLWSAVGRPFHEIVQIVGKRVYEQIVAEGEAEYFGFTLTARFFESLSRQHPLQAVQGFQGEALVVHGSEDEEVPIENCFLYQHSLWLRPNGQGDKQVIIGGNHTFSNSKSAEQVYRVTRDWLHAIDANGQAQTRFSIGG
ncbi:MAG: alpha/beta fold hydrolase [Tumebacillaceae bacterium]